MVKDLPNRIDQIEKKEYDIINKNNKLSNISS